MMNQEQENQHQKNSAEPTAEQRANEQRRIVEERLADINARSSTAEATTTDTLVESAPVEEMEESTPQAEASPEVEAPIEEPALAQSSVLTSEEPATPEAAPSEPPVQPETPAMHAPETLEPEVAPVAAATQPPAEEPSSEPTSVHDLHHHLDDEDLHAHEDLSHAPIEEIRKKIIALATEGQPKKSSRQLIEVYRQYEQRFHEERQDALKRFIADGGAADDFEYHAPKEHQDVEQAIQRYREGRAREQRQEEEQKVVNLQKKKDLLERLRVLLESSETNASGSAIKELQAEWKAIGQVPNADAQQLWNSYHALLDMYYNNRSIFFELKELDRKRNLDAKTLLCDRAESLAQEENINKALQELRNLHDEWKHIGPVPNDVRDQIWNRFIQASEKVHERKKVFLESRREVEVQNLEKKRALLAEIEQYQTFTSDRINDWRDKTDQIQQLKERWDAAGLVPKENAEEVNKAFWSSYKAFFHHKNTFFKALDEEKMQNYRQKVALCEEAESLQSSEDWDPTKEKLIQLQKKWKTIGRVPDKYSDKIWNRFRSACNAFFDRLHQESQYKETQLNQLTAAKLEYVEKLSTKIEDPALVGSLEEFNTINQEWQGLATEGKRNVKVEERFNQLLAQYLQRVPELNGEEREQKLFQLQLNQLKSSPDGDHKLYQKEQHLRRDITTLENDISTLRTNIEFFARSKNAEKLREEYQAKIDDAQGRIQHLKRQLKALRA
ncbi:DUF349 domain-containing protein [Nibribacter ruber]|uniref:DUF349 domain-containing protein n=1 Tax=Nibribacter ruber TaxID=2698458 RepID=A0A6P1NX48_9BACT|nr:DUF349 domain-containing protein [Nibribacter ruber]QHL86385.1 DUF349 domain-containing protein [Nibribacter ruber]